MFLDEKKEGEAETKPGMIGFVAWLTRQSPTEKYDANRPQKCALGQYYKTIGRECRVTIAEVADDFGVEYWLIFNAVATEPRTFGAALQRARSFKTA